LQRFDGERIVSETTSHQRAKAKAAGKGGQTEKPLPGKRRLDAISHDGKKATEVERSGSAKNLKKAVSRLISSGAPKTILQVPHKDIRAAHNATGGVGAKVTVKNMGGTKQSPKAKPELSTKKTKSSKRVGRFGP
jgi:hypothetical protein